MDNRRTSNQRTKQQSHSNSRIDIPILTVVAILAVVSMLTIFSTTYLQHSNASLMPTLMQGIWYVVGFILMFIAMQFDHKSLYDFAVIAYFIGLALLILVLIFYDRELAVTNGARSWFSIGPFSFQPSEIMKIAYILMMGRLVSQYNHQGSQDQIDAMSRKDRIRYDFSFLVKLFFWTLPPLLLVILQNDLGTTLVFMVIFVGVVLVSGITWHIIAPVGLFLALIAVIVLLLVFYNRDFLEFLGFQPYQFARIDSWLNPFGNTANESYQLAQSLKAIGSGGMFGKGLGQFEVYVPVRESDMIFATIGENFGFIGGAVLILLYFILIYQMISISYQSHDAFYATMVAGIVMMLTFHIVENIGMSVGLLPLTGIPLPFISMGGTSLINNMLSVGLVLSIKYQEEATASDLEKNWLVKIVRKLNQLLPAQLREED
ncbi:FtsW/RodA/SpoVE family cell cycle protein [Aerococcus kribbianus]|uniref:FtsW/RodA/SpoVE family cell cycle protein n=1 Tax=Aerococcus kribbianus TaxID=2999064 RepID=A0A9X3JEE2_9LACT|nr:MULTISPECIES: FtsW/RodA/SpoVE family cell cycle protein [unclassified Aerococcus]MCZ0717004.1 FtsW/RodA/SpoVE family cell cycle protein [Aerococcus sp. YH-aer221]MCZ0725292.1 FtsW/RodA/SpoVE family cell cycle protein [Aerococcus sp. YH-aer222]